MNLLDANEVRLLTEVGFLAAARADVKRAEVIFSALEHPVVLHSNVPNESANGIFIAEVILKSRQRVYKISSIFIL